MAVTQNDYNCLSIAQTTVVQGMRERERGREGEVPGGHGCGTLGREGGSTRRPWLWHTREGGRKYQAAMVVAH